MGTLGKGGFLWKIRIGVIGTGLAWERLHYLLFKNYQRNMKLGRFKDRNREAAEEWGRRLGLHLGRMFIKTTPMLHA